MTRITTMWIAAMFVVAVDVWCLIGVFRNRRDDPQFVLQLTEREAPLAVRERENTALYLRLRLGSLELNEDEPGWFDKAKLEAVGFDCGVGVGDLDDMDAPEAYRRQPNRFAYVVLENGGPVWNESRTARRAGHLAMIQRMAERGATEDELRQATSLHAIETVTESRLIPIDVGLDKDALRMRYPDRSVYAIVPAAVGIRVVSRREQSGQVAARWLEGSLLALLVPRLHVPPESREALEAVVGRSAPADDARHPVDRFEAIPEAGPRYRVNVRYGSRLEPWISSIEAIPPEELVEGQPSSTENLDAAPAAAPREAVGADP